MTHPHNHRLIFLLFVTILFVLLTLPIWQWLWGEWLGNDYYSHGLLIPLVSLFLAIQRLRLNKNTAGERSLTPALPTAYGLLILLASIGGYLFFLNQNAYYLAAFALIAMIGGMVWTIGSQRLLRLWLFPLLYLVLMVPLPFVERATYPLAIFAGLCGGGLVRFLGIDVTIIGNAVTLPNAELVIGAQCSGINSLMALTALMILAAYLLEGAWWGKLVLVLLAIPLAILGNILRIASLLYVARAYGAQAAFIFYHDYSGIVFFICILLLIVPLTRLLQINALRLDVI
ncbi:MAG: exosortase/archaeosortase family protein [Caldilineaceae bacterium]